MDGRAGSVVQQERGAGQVQVQHPQCQARGDQGHGEPASLPLRTGQGLGIQEIYQVYTNNECTIVN